MTNLVWIPADQPKTILEKWNWPMAAYMGSHLRPAGYILSEQPIILE